MADLNPENEVAQPIDYAKEAKLGCLLVPAALLFSLVVSVMDGLMLLLVWNSFLAEQFGPLTLSAAVGLALAVPLLTTHYTESKKNRKMAELWEDFKGRISWTVTIYAVLLLLVLVLRPLV
jgi:hypothetical protein